VDVTKLPAKANREIQAAKVALELCQTNPAAAVFQIQQALHHVREANSWIVARILCENYRAENRRQKGAKS
jgi:hypothetical protein